MKYYYLLLVIVATFVGGYLRFANLGDAPLWCDEAAFATSMVNFTERQEYLPAAIARILGTSDELRTRIPFALAGTLSILAVYLAKPSKYTVCAAILIAVFPLFVWWSRMCRPYAMAGLFVILSWKWRWCMIPAILCTPLAVVGIDWVTAWKEWKKEYDSMVWRFLAVLVGFAGVMYMIRGDLSRPGFGSLGMFFTAPRLWYIPILVVLLYLTYHILPRVEENWTKKKSFVLLVVGSTICLFSVFFTQSVEIPSMTQGTVYPWYSNILYYNNWRGMPQVDLATNFTAIPLYYTGKGALLLRTANPNDITPDQIALVDEPKIHKLLAEKDTILIGVDSYANNQSNYFFPPGFLDPIRQHLHDGEVFLVRMRRTSKHEHFTIESMPRSMP